MVMYVLDLLKEVVDFQTLYNSYSTKRNLYCDQIINSGLVRVIDFVEGGEEVIKLGKYLHRYFTFSPSEITHIVEKCKAQLDVNKGIFKIISGDDIANAYYRVNYVPSHNSLNNSCMRYKRCQDDNYFQIYKDVAKMLVMVPKRGKRILGRAILWPYKDTFMMDRVYVTDNTIEYQFYKYAKENGFIILNKNNYLSRISKIGQFWLVPYDNYTKPTVIPFSIQTPGQYTHFPFMDSFRYYNDSTKKLSTYWSPGDRSLCDTLGNSFYIE